MFNLVRQAALVLVGTFLVSYGPALAVDTSIPGEACAPESPGGTTFHFEEETGPAIDEGVCGSAGTRCGQPMMDGGPSYSLVPGAPGDPACDPNLGVCKVQVRVPLLLPGNQQNITDGSGRLFFARWFTESTPPACDHLFTCGQVSTCGQTGSGSSLIDTDRAVFTATRSMSCAQMRSESHALSLTAWSCIVNATCRKHLDVANLDLDGEAMALEVGCDPLPPPPPPNDCKEDGSCEECPGGLGVGGGGSAAGGSGAPGDPAPGGGAFLWYAAGGVGHPDYPGSSAWNVTLGRYWSHSYAQRIVLDPDDSHVWLVTEHGVFRELGDLVADHYEAVSPSDEYRELYRIGTTGWELRSDDSTVMEFDDLGRWVETRDRNGNTKRGFYDPVESRLERVEFPDGLVEHFGYHPVGDPQEGKLASIRQVGVDGTSEREWLYTWTGDDLTKVERPDGSVIEYFYDDPAHPGYLTLIDLVSEDGSERRHERGYEYDPEGNAYRTWRGATSFDDPAAVERWELVFDDPADPTETRVRDPLYPLSPEAVYTLDRDPASRKPRIQSIQGSCPACGVAPETSYMYTDPFNPMLPTKVTDGEGHVTVYAYDSETGQVVSKIEASGVTGERETTYEYDDANHPALLTAVEQPSVQAGSYRRTEYDRDPLGNVTARRQVGFGESGFPFETAMDYNAGGGLTAVDPPGFGDAGDFTDSDVTSFVYDPTRGNGDLVLQQRFDPLLGTPTEYDHDAFNRRTSETDPNGVETKTEYDALDRVTKIIRVGASSPAEDLVTESFYTDLGDLEHTILPRGNVIDYEYDAAGRLIAVERRPDLVTHGERIFYTLDDAGNRIRREQQHWDETLLPEPGWVSDSTTDYLYTTRCHLDKVVHPDGTVTEYAYDCNGNLTQEWDANHPSASNGATTIYGYDALDRLTTVTRPWPSDPSDPSVTTYGYDVQDHLTSVTDAEGNVTTYTYSDRDLLIQEVSPVSGSTTHTYNEHGELETTTDARMITVTRMVDELDRVAEVDYPEDSLDTVYSYGTDPATFSLGRLTGITRDGETVDYAWDRFGRVIQDGELTFGYDDNGNRTDIGYPGDVSAAYTFDYADREKTLTVRSHEGTAEETSTSVVTAAGYYPSGPLSALALGNGVTETRGFTTRYFPDTITLDAPRVRSWTYSTDAVGNITGIVSAGTCDGDVSLTDVTVDGPQPFTSCAALEAGPNFTVTGNGTATLTAGTRVVLNTGFSVEAGGQLVAGIDPTLSGNTTKTYGYHPTEYLLTSAGGPWGSLEWTYDRIGNRTSEIHAFGTDLYYYDKNGLSGTGGNTALLRTIAPALGGSRGFNYTPAGHQEEVNNNGNVVTFTYDDAGRLSEANRTGAAAACPFVYDGRGYLRQAGDLATTGTVVPTYDSAGLLHSLLKQPSATEPQRRYQVFYLAGRPVAQLATEAAQPDRWWYLTTDHLGTPLLATDAAGAELWENRFEPFGGDPTGQASEAEIFLRFPGQWDDGTWADATQGAVADYNVYRWYTPGTGRYGRPDPIRLLTGANNFLYGRNTYLYAEANPLVLVDFLGLYGTNDCSYYEQRCQECGGKYYCTLAPRACKAFGATPDPDPSRGDDFEGWRRCTRKCLQDCDANNFDDRKQCDADPCAEYGPANPDPATDGFFDESHQDCHKICYVYCHFWGTWGEGQSGMQPQFR